MTSPDAEDPHAIADTQMFRRFVDEGRDEAARPASGWRKLWVWPGLLIPAIVSIAIVVALIIILTS